LIVKELQICRMWMFHHCRNCRRYASWLARSFRQPFHLMRHCRTTTVLPLLFLINCLSAQIQWVTIWHCFRYCLFDAVG